MMRTDRTHATRLARGLAGFSIASLAYVGATAPGLTQTRSGSIDPGALCAAITLDVDRAEPLERVSLGFRDGLGFPNGDGNAAFAAVIVRSDGDDDPFVLPLIAAGDDRTELVVPPHPSMALAGGNVTLSIVAALASGSDGGTHACEPVPFRILPLPPAPDAVRVVRASLDDLFGALGHLDRMTEQPTGLADTLSEATHATLDEALDDEGLDEDEIAMRNALLARADVARGVARQAWVANRFATSAAERNGEIAPGVPRGFLRRIQIGAPLGIACPSDMTTLARMMGEQSDAERAIRTTNAVAAPTLTGLGFVPHPAAKAATNVGGVALTAANAGLAFVQGTYPSAFEPRLLFSLSKTRFEEDNPQRGRVTNVTVKTISKGFDASGVIADVALQAAAMSDIRLVRQTTRDLLTNSNHVRGEAINLAQDTLMANIVKAGTGNSLVVPPQRCAVTAFEDLPQWFEHEIVTVFSADGPAFKALEWQNELAYFPMEVGQESLGVRLRRDRERFGYQALPEWSRQIEVKPIVVSIDPGDTRVRPGDVVTMRADVRDALDTGVRWTLDGSGHEIESTNDPNLVRIRTSESREDFPVFVKAISTSKGGQRSLPDAPERFDVALIMADLCQPALTASAQCTPGEPAKVSAQLVQDASCPGETGVGDWSASHPASLSTADATQATFSLPEGHSGMVEVRAKLLGQDEPPEPVSVDVQCGQLRCEDPGSADLFICLPYDPSHNCPTGGEFAQDCAFAAAPYLNGGSWQMGIEMVHEPDALATMTVDQPDDRWEEVTGVANASGNAPASVGADGQLNGLEPRAGGADGPRATFALEPGHYILDGSYRRNEAVRISIETARDASVRIRGIGSLSLTSGSLRRRRTPCGGTYWRGPPGKLGVDEQTSDLTLSNRSGRYEIAIAYTPRCSDLQPSGRVEWIQSTDEREPEAITSRYDPSPFEPYGPAYHVQPYPRVGTALGGVDAVSPAFRRIGR